MKEEMNISCMHQENKEPHRVAKAMNAEVSVEKCILHCTVSDETQSEVVVLHIVYAFCSEITLELPFEIVQSRELFSRLERVNVVFPVDGKKKKEFQNNILMQRSVAKRVSEIIAPSGFFKYDNEILCKFGQSVYNRDGICNKFPKDINAPIIREKEKDSYLKALDYVWVDESVAPMVLLELELAIWDKLLEEGRCSQRHTLYVVGPTGTMKSSIVREATKVFGEKSEMTLSSTYAALQKTFNRYAMIPFFLDDYNESDFAKVKREKGEKLVEIIQLHADREALAKVLAKEIITIELDSSLIVTAEKPLENPSSMNRCLVVTPANVNEAMLTEIQMENRNNAIFVDLIQKIIYYTINNYENICENIPNMLEQIEEKVYVFSEYEDVLGYHRVLDSFRVASVGLEILNDFLLTCLPKKDRIKIIRRISSALEDSVIRTFGLLDKPDMDMEILSILYGEFHKAQNKKKFASSKNDFERKNKGKYIGLLDDKQKLYIPGYIMQEMVSHKMKKDVSKKRISSALHHHGLIASYKGRYSRSISGMDGNERYYCINYKKLKRMFLPKVTDIFKNKS